MLSILIDNVNKKSNTFLIFFRCEWIWLKGKMWCDHRNSNQVFFLYFLFFVVLVTCKTWNVCVTVACVCISGLRVGHPRDILKPTGWAVEVFKALLWYVLLMSLRWFGLTFADALWLKQISCHHKTACSGSTWLIFKGSHCPHPCLQCPRPRLFGLLEFI